MADYLDKHGLGTLWQRIKDYVRTAISGIEGTTPSSTTPKEDGDASAGTETTFARGDHRHPHDTSKVDKVDGKGLSTYDYDNIAKAKVDAIPYNPQYTDTTYTAGEGINIDENNVISVIGGGGGGISYVPTTRTINNKQLSSDIYLDASDVGALPSSTVIPTVPTNVSAFNNDAGYLTSHQDISGKADKATTLAGYGITDAKIENGTIILGSDTITPLTSHQSLTNYVQKSQTAGLLKNDGTVDQTQYGTYSKPQTGIPASDLASGVIPDINGKADKTLVSSSMPSGGFLPNTVYNLGTLSGNTTFLMAAATDNTIANIWCWTFTTPSTAPTITWPAAITDWVGGSTPTINASKSYEVTVMNGFATIIES